MRQAFAHDAVVTMDAAGDDRAPGGAVTVALCGAWDHEPPCPLAPHHIGAQRAGDEVRLRVLFAAEPAAEAEARRRIADALAQGVLVGPDGGITRWRLLGEQPGKLRDDEAGHAASLLRS